MPILHAHVGLAKWVILRDLLAKYRPSLNGGVEDLARLIGAAEVQAAGHYASPITAGEIMSRDLVTERPDTRFKT